MKGKKLFRKVKKILAFILAVVLFGVNVPILDMTVQAEETTQPYSGTMQELYEIVKERIEEKLFSGDWRDVDLTDLNISSSDYFDLRYIRYYFPYFDNDLNTTLGMANGIWKNISINNPYSTKELKAHMAKPNQKAKELIELVQTGDTELEKVLILYEYMAAHYTYDTAGMLDLFNGKIIDHLPYGSGGLLLNDTGVCNAYAHLMQYILTNVGVECHRVINKSANHTWNIVKIDDAYYHVDATLAAQAYGCVNRSNFLLSDETISGKMNHESWDDIGIICSSNKYEDAFWQEVESKLFVQGNICYYINEEAPKAIMARNLTTNEVTVVKELSGNTLFNLFGRNGMLYYNTPSEIRKISLDGGVDELVLAPSLKTNAQIYGCTMKDGMLQYNIQINAEDGSVSFEQFTVEFPDTPEAEGLFFEADEYIIGYADSEFLPYSLYPEYAESNITWSTSDESIVSVDGEGMVTAHKLGCATLTAEIENGSQTSCTVTVQEGDEFMLFFEDYIDGEMQRLDLEPIMVKLGGVYENLPVLPDKEGYRFRGWSIDKEDGITEYVKNGMTVDRCFVSLDAKWDAIQYAITYELNGGTKTSSMKNYYTCQNSITLGIPTKDGALFAGWFEEEELLTQVSEIAKGSIGDKKYYAKWIEKTDVIENAVRELEEYIDLEDYREEQQIEISALIDVAETQMETAVSVKDVEAIVKQVKIELNWIKTSEEITSEEALGQPPVASDDIWDIPVDIMNVTAGNEEPLDSYNTTQGSAEFVLDGNSTTLWHTKWNGSKREEHWLQFALTEDYTVKGLRYLPRQDANNNGIITEYIIEVSDDGNEWSTVEHERWEKNSDWKIAWFPGQKVSYVRLKVENAGSETTQLFASAAEIRLLGGKMYPLFYELDGGVNHPDNPTAYAYDNLELPLKTAAKDGFFFESWYADAGLTEKISGIEPLSSGERTVYAKYVPKEDVIERVEGELETYKDPSVYREAQKEELLEALEEGKETVEAATSIEEVESAVEAAKEVMDAIKTDAELTEEEEAAFLAALAEAKKEATEELETYKDPSVYREAQKEELLEAIEEGRGMVEAAISIEEVESAVEAAKEVMDAIKTDAELTEEEEAAFLTALAEAKKEATEKLETYKDPSVYREAQKEELLEAIEEGKEMVEAATSIEEVESAVEAVKEVMDTIKTDAELTEEEKQKNAVTRISGTDRYATGYKVADALKTALGVDKFDAIVVATGKNFADALAGSYLAAENNAPIILTNGKAKNIVQLHDYIKTNVKVNGTVYILGGEAAVPAEVEAISEYKVVRLYGKSRYETNLAILAEVGVKGDEIIVATGKSFADSLSASATKLPILLVKPNETLNNTQRIILANINRIYIIGGESAVSKIYEEELKQYGSVDRVAGKSRYETSVAIAETFFADTDAAVVASGRNFPDGLCGGPLAAAMNAPLVLTKDGNPNVAASYMTSNAILSGYILGGTGALSNETVVDVFELESVDKIIN